MSPFRKVFSPLNPPDKLGHGIFPKLLFSSNLSDSSGPGGNKGNCSNKHFPEWTLTKGKSRMMKIWFTVLLFMVFRATLSGEDPKIITLEPHKFYCVPDTDHVLTFKAYYTPISHDELHYSIHDLYGNEILKDTAITENDIDITTTINLPRGYYRIYFPALNTYFGLTVLPFRVREPDRFFAVHASLTKNDELTLLDFSDGFLRQESLVKTLKNTGIGLVRERIRPAVFAPSPGEFVYDGNSHRYEEARMLYDQYDIDVMGFFAITNWWMRRPNDRVNPTERHNRYPVNMHAITDVWDSIAKRWDGVLKNIEIWNEPRSGTQDRLAPLYHSIAYSFKDQEYPKILGSGYTAGTMEKYVPDMGNMRALDVIDKISFHQYTDPEITSPMVRTMRTNLDKFGIIDMPVINSESGAQYVGGIWPEYEQNVTGGGISAGRAVENRAFGQRHFFEFVYSPVIRNDYDKQNSQICVSGTALLDFASYLHAVLLLSHREYIGDLDISSQALMQNRVFAGADTAVVTLYRNYEENISLPVQPLILYGQDGRVLDLVDGKIPLSDPMVYAIYKRSDVESFLKTDTEAMKYYTISQNVYQPARSPYPVSVLHIPDYEELEFSNTAYLMNDIINQSASFSYRAYNLSDSEQTIEMELSLPAWLKTAESLKKSITIPPDNYSSFSWQVEFVPESEGFLDEVWIRPTAESDSLVHPLMFRVQCLRPLEEILDDYRSYRKLYLFNQSKWREYGRNEAMIDVTVMGDTIVFKMNVSDEKDWMAGTYNVSDVDFTHVKGFFADARVDAKPDNGSRFWPLMKFGFMEDGEGGHYYCKEFPLDGERTWVYAELDDIPIDLGDENQNLDRDRIVDFRARFRQGVPGVEVNAELFAIYLVSDTLMFSDTIFDAGITLINDGTGEPLEDVEVSFGEDTLITNEEGKVLFEGLSYGYYNINADVEGFYPEIERRYIELYQDTSFIFSLYEDRPDVTIYFTDYSTGDPISGVAVSSFGKDYFTNTLGQVIISDVEGEDLLISATHDQYFEIVDSFQFKNDTTINIQLTSRLADVFFEVTDTESAIIGAFVSFNGILEVSNPAGYVRYYNQSARKKYYYEIEADGYSTIEDSIFLEADTTVQVLMNPLSYGSFNSNNNLDIYPNPASEFVYVKLKKGLSNNFQLELFDLLGNKIWSFYGKRNNLEIDVGNLENGIYLLSIKSDDIHIVSKLYIRNSVK